MSYLSKIFSLVALGLSVYSPLAGAATIDELQVQASVSSPETAGGRTAINTAHSRAIGGSRTLIALNVDGSPGSGITRIETKTTGGEVVLTVGSHRGRGTIVWNGNSNPNSSDRSGLNSLNLTRDNADAFKLQIKEFDYPGSQAMTIRLRIYGPSADLSFFPQYSQVEITFNQYVDVATGPVNLVIPFSLFITPGDYSASGFAAKTSISEGGAVATNVGAIEIQFEGRAIDLVAGPLTTNGRCAAVPNSNGTVFDECGVCLDDATNANLGRDACGTCFKGPPGYSYENEKKFDMCGVCSGNNSTCKDCAGVINGPARLDACGVCGGLTTDPLACNVVTNRCVTVTATEDVKKFERQLVIKARTLRKRYLDERDRSTRNSCKIATSVSDEALAAAFRHIVTRSNEIFSAGVEVCGDSCITTSYATQVEALKPQFKILQQEVVSLAKKVNSCYKRRGIVRNPQQGSRRVTETLTTVSRGLDRLIEECRKKQVCPPGTR